MIDITKKYRTRDGRAVRILATDIKSESYPVAAVIRDADGDEQTETYSDSGRYQGKSVSLSGLDLIEVVEAERFVNVYQEGFISNWPDLETANKQARADRAGVAKLVIRDGKLVEAEVL